MTMLRRWRIQLWSFALLALGCGDDGTQPSRNQDAGEVNDAGKVGSVSTSEVTLSVPLRGKGAQEIHATVWSGGASSGATVLALHGLSESAAVYGPLAKRMIEDTTWQKRVRRVIALDMPGHGKSNFPDVAGGPKFGELAIEDYVGIVIDAVKALRAKDMAPSVAIGHSMGGLELQAAQETLIASDSSLSALGIVRVVLLSPVPPHAAQWMTPMTGDLSAFVVADSDQGAYLQLPAALFVAQSFGKPDLSLAADAPTPDEAMDAGYPAREPMSVLLQLLEAPTMLPDGTMLMPKRPSAREGAFEPSHGTTLELAAFSQDALVPAGDLMKLYPYLIGGTGTLLDTIEADNAVHNMFVSDPEHVLGALQWPDLAKDTK